jgi:glycosyltransferase involved in cell wall biosynthesis
MQEGIAGPLVIANYDFRSSGAAAKSIQIAAAAHAAGLPAELWVVRAQGALLSRVPAGVPVVETGSNLRVRHRSADLIAGIPALAGWIRKRRPSVLLSGGNHFHLAARAALLLSGLRSQVRFGLRISNSLRHRHGATVTRMNALKCRGADFVAAVSESLAGEVRAELPDMPVHCIPNGCDVARIRQLMQSGFEHRFFDGTGVVISTMGRLSRQKGHDILIQALALLRPQIEGRLLVVGEGSARDVARLRGLAERHGVGAQVDFVGYQANPFGLIGRSDLYVCASRWEGFCNALVEALACGVPVVATDCPTGNREILHGGGLGTLAPPESPAQLAQAMRAELAQRRDAAERARQLARFELQRCLDEWTRLLRSEYGMTASAAIRSYSS